MTTTEIGDVRLHAEAMAAFMESQLEDDDEELREAVENLREAVGLEERH